MKALKKFELVWIGYDTIWLQCVNCDWSKDLSWHANLAKAAKAAKKHLKKGHY